MSLLTNPILAKLLAKENLEVRHGNFRTAWFDVENRVLGLPIWKDHGKDVYDLLVGHEVGHALFTPSEGWHESNEEIKGCPRGYLNVIEDVRIERKIRETYPGLISPMRRGYKVLVEKGFFGDIDSYNMDQMKLIDKINLKSKLSTEVDVPFNAEEQALFDRSLVAETWSEVVQIVRDILAYTKALEDNKVELPQAQSEQGEENDDDSDVNENQPSVTAAPEEDEESDEDQNTSDAGGEEEPTSSEDGETDTQSANQSSDPVEEEKSMTDEIFRSREQELLDVDDDGCQPTFVRELTKAERDSCVVKYAKLAESRAAVRHGDNPFVKYELQNNLPGEFTKYYKDVKRAIIPAVKEFEMRKAAYQYQRSASAKTGSIDVNRVHSYKFNDDIFKRVTLQADAKNHGMFLLIDFSGSMYDTIGNVLDQVSHLVAFCKAVNIPFEVYGFTSTNNAHQSFEPGSMDLDSLSLFQMTSSSLKKKDFEESMYEIWLRQYSSKRESAYEMRCVGIAPWNIYSPIEDFGSTPLHQSLIISHYLVKEMIAKNNIEKMNFVTLTDGDTNSIRVARSYNSDNDIAPTRSTYSIIVDKKMIKPTLRSEVSQAILENMARTLGTTNIGFFVAENNREMHYRCYRAQQDSSVTTKHYLNTDGNAEFRKNRCVAFQDTLGYSEYYVLKSGDALSTSEDEGFGSVDSSVSKGKMTSEFKKFSKSKKTNRVLMTKFAKAVA